MGSILLSPRGSGNRPITGSRGSAAPIQERNRTETTPFSRGSAALIPSSRGIREYGEERNRTETTHLEEMNTKEDKLLIIDDHQLKVIYI